MSDDPAKQNLAEVEGLVDGLSDAKIARLVVVALRATWRTGNSKRCDHFQVNDRLGRELVTVFAEAKNETASPERRERLKEVFLSTLLNPKLRPIGVALWALVHRGFFVPSLVSAGNGDLLRVHPTKLGERLLDTEEDHPAIPGFLRRAADQCNNLPEEVLLHLDDAQRCLDAGLLRAGVVLAGLSYEVAIDKLLDTHKPRIGKKPWEAKERIEKLEKLLPAIVDPSARARARAALTFAETLRDRRNAASHPGQAYPFTSGELEELVWSAGRLLPGLWTLHTDPAP